MHDFAAAAVEIEANKIFSQPCIIFETVIGECGMHGLNPTGKPKSRILGIRAAEHSVTLLDEFRNTSAFVRTAPYAQAVLNETSYNGLYHYNGRADTYFKIGQDFGKAMLQLMDTKKRHAAKVAETTRKVKKRVWSDFFAATM